MVFFAVIKGFTQTKVVQAAKDEKKTLPNACHLGEKSLLKEMKPITTLKDTKISGTLKVQAVSSTRSPLPTLTLYLCYCLFWAHNHSDPAIL